MTLEEKTEKLVSEIKALIEYHQTKIKRIDIRLDYLSKIIGPEC